MFTNRIEPLLLLVGDFCVFYVSLWLTLIVRYLEFPVLEKLLTHTIPFLFLFLIWILVYFIAGLYDRQTVLLKRKLPGVIFRVQLTNVLFAALFFFFIPYFTITPKTTLAIYLFISFAGVVLWRLSFMRFFGVRRRQPALLLGGGDEILALFSEINGSNRYGIQFVHHIDFASDANTAIFELGIQDIVRHKSVTAIVVDTHDEKLERLLPAFYNLLLKYPGLTFIDAAKLYEVVFRRIPISLLDKRWFLEHVRSKRAFYDTFHRLFDIIVSFTLGIPVLVLTPFIALAIKLDDGGPVFTFQTRVGQYNRPLKLVKFRTMRFNDQGVWRQDIVNEITRIGAFLRKTRIDELPQLWNVLRGGYSLIGPRPEFPGAVHSYVEHIPYYNARHLAKPGLSGWAQIYHDRHPHHAIDVTETKTKLSYDLFYIKNRSVFLDIEIALKTIRTLLSQSGS